MMPLETGDPAPVFSAPTEANPVYAFGAAAGRWIILMFIGSLAHPASRAAHETIQARRGVFNDRDASFFGVSHDPEDITVRGLKNATPGLRYFHDHNRAVHALYDIGGEGSTARAFLLDRTMRIVTTEPLERISALLDALETGLSDEARSPAVLMAPVLTVPRVFEPELCDALIAYYKAEERHRSGVMREVDGMTVGVQADHFKSRRDASVEDEGLKQLTRQRITRRLLPQIQRAFHWQATRLERYLVACYSAEEGGFFRAHRDNTTAGTAHRVFAVSINLNDGYEGGDLVFPEYGQGRYRPPPGGATVFNCSLLHAATAVTSGTRYVFVPFLYDERGAEIRARNLAKLGRNDAASVPVSEPDPVVQPAS